MDAVQQIATVGVASAALLGGNLHRTGLLVSPPSGGRITLAFGAIAVLDQGPTVQVGTQAIRLTRHELGHLIQLPINAIADAAGRTISIIEYFEAGD